MVSKLFKVFLCGVLVLSMLYSLFSISYAANTPTINSFTVDKNLLKNNQSTQLHWDVADAKKLN
jgi:hypothetical protein